jgi:hypothetical protein
VIARTIPPGADLLYTFPRHALAGVEFEVVSVHDAGLANAGLLKLDNVFAAGNDGVWIQRGSQTQVTWFESDGDFEVHMPSATMLPAALLDAGLQTLTDYGAQDPGTGGTVESIHVPVVTPSDKPEEYGPPVLEDEPLPPV